MLRCVMSAIARPSTPLALAALAAIAAAALGGAEERRITFVAHDATRGYTIPLHYSAHGPRLVACFPGSAALRLQLDSGTRGVVLTRRAARRARIERVAEREVRALGETGARRGWYGLREALHVGELALERPEVEVLPRGAAVRRGEDGSIGTDVFAEFVVHIDGCAGLLTLEPNRTPTAVERLDELGWRPARRVDGRFFVAGTVADGPTGWFLIDTGADSLVLDATAIGSLGRAVGPVPGVTGLGGQIADAERREGFDLTVAGLRLPSAEALVFDLRPLGDAAGLDVVGLLGDSALRELRLSLDFRRARVRLARCGGDRAN